MATKYAGQNALNKLMQIIKTALANKADKTALDDKLDKTGGTIAGNVIVEGTVEAEGSITIREAGSLAHIGLMPSGDNAASIVSTSSTGKSGNARLVVGTPTGDNDATTKAYVDSKIAAGGVTVDDSVSDTSTNPVQNKAIKAELDKTGQERWDGQRKPDGDGECDVQRHSGRPNGFRPDRDRV